MTMANGEVMCASAMGASSAKGGSGGTSTGRTAGINVGSSAGQAPEVNGQKPVPIQTLANTVWQGMRIQAQTMTPIRFVTFDGVDEHMVDPPKDASFHLMIMLSDARTGEPIPYSSSVWATITNSKGQTVFDSTQWPMISAYMGPHYGDDVPHLPSGDYKLSVLVAPPQSARASQYRAVWLRPHNLTARFGWNAKTATATVLDGSARSSAGSGSIGDTSGMDMHRDVPVGGARATAPRLIATSYWQGMRIQARMAPTRPVYVYGDSGIRRVAPPAGSSFYMMVMLNDRHTDEPVTYVPVSATIKNSAGTVVYENSMQPTISPSSGPFYGNNVRLPGPGRYSLALRIEPPRQARHLEYQHVWLKPHTVVEHFTWAPSS